ncbi:Cytochrome P450 [Apiospora arundinis]
MRASETGGYEKQNSRDMLTFLVEETLPGGPAEGIKENHFLGHEVPKKKPLLITLQILQLMVGGVDTTANMLAWSSYVLANHHDIQDKLRREILNFLARVSEPTYADINTLPYLNGFVKELLRAQLSTAKPSKTSSSTVCSCPGHHGGGDLGHAHDEPAGLGRRRRRSAAGAVGTPHADPEVALRVPGLFRRAAHVPGKNLAYVEMKVILVEIMRQYRFLRVVTQPKLHNPSLILHAHELEVSVERIK